MHLPFDLQAWIDDHRDEFEPPVSNKVVWTDSDFIFMVVRGPNARSDFHIDPGDEIFYQMSGVIRVDTVDAAGTHRQMTVEPGSLLLVPGGTPHSPHRPADSWGLVIERQRRPGEVDRLRWYCDCCDEIVHEVVFELADIETELAAALESFNSSITLRTCDACGCIAPVPQPFVLDERSWTDER